MRKYIIFLLVLLLLNFHLSAFAETGYKAETAWVYESSSYGHEYYALIVCKKHGIIGIMTPYLLPRKKEIIVEYRNTKEGLEHIFYKELPDAKNVNLRYRDFPPYRMLLGVV